VLVVQAVGNSGPNPKTVLSFSPWILSVAAGVDDRSYPHYVTLANNMSFSGMGLARKQHFFCVVFFFFWFLASSKQYEAIYTLQWKGIEKD
jgi:hypothetical protein